VDFAKFLDRADDVFAFAKIVSKIGFFIEYLDQGKNIRLYYPDFVVKTTNDRFFLMETKGRVDIEVPLKDARAEIWCEDATELTGKEWRFVRVDQNEFERYYWEDFRRLLENF